jgi:hypothetical protein
MGRKWTNFKFKLENRNGSIDEPSSRPRTQEEALFDYIKDHWDQENIGPVKDIDVMFGNYSSDKIREVASMFFEEFSFIEKCGVVFVTDSANIGYGWVFERDNSSAVCVEEYNGYEGAFGEDVAGMIREDHYISINPDWYWD